MATKLKTRRQDTQLAFEALAIEGGLLAPEWLARVAQLQAGNQTEADYRVHKGLNLRDEIGRYWRIAQANWNDFTNGLQAGTDPWRLSERFVVALLRDGFGFESLQPVAPCAVGDHVYPIGHAALGCQVPVVIGPAALGLDAPVPAFGDGGRRRSTFGVCQEFLNAEDRALWGLATDGLTLRVLRDNTSLTRPSWLEADLERIFREARYADFAALWLAIHESRFGREQQPAADCALEAWREAGRNEGTRAREHLRLGVEEALIALGQGFLAHPANQALRNALADGSLATIAYFQELLRLAYRLIFVLTVEERGLLHAPGSTDKAKALYRDGYGLKRLRELAVRRSAHDRHHDQWEAAKIVFRGLASGEDRLGLPALAGLFAPGQCPHLDAARLENRALLLAVFRLSWLREAHGLTRVNWRDMGPEELGSVYESLLELVPQITQGGRAFGFASGDETKGNARKTSGSYYTPDSLVQVLLDSALEPVVEQTIAANPADPAKALLELSVVDPACGSGHFLLAAARRLAGHVARLQANGTPSAAEYRHALRQVVGHCIYGVDLNPMAVELCKVSLWMEAVEPGLPLTFLQSHVRHGNALLGATPELMEKGIPDAAWEPIEGDDKATASALKKRNKKAIKGQIALDLWSAPKANESNQVASAVAALDAVADTDAEALARKESQWQGLLDSPAYRHQRLVADAWCAAFVWPKHPGPAAEAAPTNDVWWALKDSVGQPPPGMIETTRRLAEQYTFFQWHLAFPQVFARGGFDVVLGNPPWERIKLQEKEFFASRAPDVAGPGTAAARKRAIARMEEDFPELWAEWSGSLRQAVGESKLVRDSGRFPNGAQGDVNTYALFAELGGTFCSNFGRFGLILPLGFVADRTTKELFGSLAQPGRLIEVRGFINEKQIFSEVMHNFRFIILVAGGRRVHVPKARYVFDCQTVPESHEPQRQFELSADELRLLNPVTATCPILSHRQSANVLKTLYLNVPALCAQSGWSINYVSMFHMANDSSLFSLESSNTSVPLLESKMFQQYNHRYASYADMDLGERSHMLPQSSVDSLKDPAYCTRPCYWVESSEVTARCDGMVQRGWVLAFREISNPVMVRTGIFAILPATAANNTITIIEIQGGAPVLASCLLACCNSFVIDFVIRQKMGGLHLSQFMFNQLPLPAPNLFAAATAWSNTDSFSDWIVPRVLELSYTAWDLEPFARDVGYNGPPFRWDPIRRFLLRAEIDAAFFHLYGLSRDDTAYILDTFPIVRKNDEKAHGEYRTKRIILEVYDAIAEAVRSGQPYQTLLDPPPADPRVAHPARTTGET